MTKHKVFISYHHKNDECYKVAFENRFKDIFINESVQDGEYAEDLSTDYIKRLIRKEKITNSSVVVVLIGTDTYKRKHVDWEIYAGLSNSGGRSGLMGILLPTYEFNPNTIPPRLYDNIKTGYAEIYNWECMTKQNIIEWIDEAFKRKDNIDIKVDNSSLQFQRNR